MSKVNLFTSETTKNYTAIDLPNAEILYVPSFFTSEEADTYFKHLKKETEWQEDDIKIFGKVYKQPRLTALYGNLNKSYSYSGITMFPKPFTPILKEIKTKVETFCNATFTTVLLNLYRDGKDSNGWHSDNEKELGINPIIASISFGEERDFHFRNIENKK